MSTPANEIYGLLSGDDDVRLCKDIPESACRHLPRNFLIHLVALGATKTGDLLASPKLVLPWLLHAAGVPAAFSAWLVPIRESGSMAPQMLVAHWIRKAPRRKNYWVFGSLVQALALLGIWAAVAGLPPLAAGFSCLGLMLVFSLARGLCSVAVKDVMGKTVSRQRRGRVSGDAASLAGLMACGLATALILGVIDQDAAGLLLLVAAALWLLGALLYMGVVESPGATEGGVSAWQHAWAAMGRLRSDEVLRRFVLTRALLLGTALSAPFYVALAAEAGGTMSGFGGLLLAQGAADFLSGPVWGRMSDRSSRRVMLLCAALATALGLAVLICASAQVQGLVGMLVYALAYGLLSVIHAGVRLARKTYVIDAAGADDRADYVAVSNTATGLLLLLGGALGSAAALLGPQYAVLLFAFGTAAAMVVGRRLPEVED